LTNKLSIGQVISILEARAGNKKIEIDTEEELIQPLLELCKEFYDNGIELRKENKELDQTVFKLGSAHEYINFLTNKLYGDKDVKFFSLPKDEIKQELNNLFTEFTESEFNTLLEKKGE
jgi:hypothetical protein